MKTQSQKLRKGKSGREVASDAKPSENTGFPLIILNNAIGDWKAYQKDNVRIHMRKSKRRG